MKQIIEIVDVLGREILDSRGNPTVEVEVYLEDGTVGRAAVPSGASTGIYEACELRDGDKGRYNGKGVQNAVNNVNTEIAEALIGTNVLDQVAIDKMLIDLDGTPNKSRLGANAILGASLACAKAAAESLGTSLYNYIGGVNAKHAARAHDEHPQRRRPRHQQRGDPGVHDHARGRPLLPGGPAHVRRGVPPAEDRPEGERHPRRRRGRRGRLRPQPEEGRGRPEGDRPGHRARPATSPARTSRSPSTPPPPSGGTRSRSATIQPKSGKKLTQQQLVNMWKKFADTYPIISLEDGMAETDWEGWAMLTKAIGDRVQLVGDDLFVTNVERLATGIEKKVGNAILIKVNQIGTLTETLDAIQMANRAGYTAIVSHRSGETEDATIADIAVALNAGQIKTGAPSRTDRVAKYNQLLRIEEELGDVAEYPGMSAFFNLR